MLVTQVRCLVFLPGSRNWIYSNVRAKCGWKIFLVELPGSRICRNILLMVFKALHMSGVTAGLEEKARFRLAMVLRTCWKHNGLWQAGMGRRVHPIVVQLLLAWSWPAVGQAQHRPFQHTLSTCKQFHLLNLLTKITGEKREEVLGTVLASTYSVCMACRIPEARCVVYFIIF